MWDLNVKSIFFLIKESKELLKKAGKDANVLVISSVGGSGPHHTLGVYNMTKAALDNMVKWLAMELLDENIRVNGLAPGLIMTEFSGVLWKDNKGVHEKSKGKPEEIGSAAASICSTDGSFINGTVVHVNGGFHHL